MAPCVWCDVIVSVISDLATPRSWATVSRLAEGRSSGFESAGKCVVGGSKSPPSRPSRVSSPSDCQRLRSAVLTFIRSLDEKPPAITAMYPFGDTHRFLLFSRCLFLLAHWEDRHSRYRGGFSGRGHRRTQTAFLFRRWGSRRRLSWSAYVRPIAKTLTSANALHPFCNGHSEHAGETGLQT